jgi:hypothetical protein
MKKQKRKKYAYIASFRRFRIHHRILFYILGAMGVIFIWRGVWMLIDQTPIFSYPLTSLAVGVGLTIFAGVFFELV